MSYGDSQKGSFDIFLSCAGFGLRWKRMEKNRESSINECSRFYHDVLLSKFTVDRAQGQPILGKDKRTLIEHRT